MKDLITLLLMPFGALAAVLVVVGFVLAMVDRSRRLDAELPKVLRADGHDWPSVYTHYDERNHP